MKKRILAAMMAAVMVFSMAGCGSKADEKTDDTAKTRARIQKRNPGKRQRSRYLLQPA